MASDAPPRVEQALESFAAHCRAALGPEQVRAASQEDAVRGVPARLVVAPGSDEEVAAALRLANDAGLTVVPRGGGTKLDWGNPPAWVDVVLSLARLDRVLDHAWADLTATVQAGCTVAELQRTLARNGQRLAVDVLWPEHATVGGILSTNDSGALRLRYGGLRDLVIGVTLALADGTLAASGGRVVKNVAGFDLQKLATGALGTLGVITQATFRVHPLPQSARTLTIGAPSMAELAPTLVAIRDSALAHTALQVRASYDTAPEMDVLLEGIAAGIDAQQARIAALAEKRPLTENEPQVWDSRARLWDRAAVDGTAMAVAKLAVPPGALTATLDDVAIAVGDEQVTWAAVMQATGVGYLRLDGPLGRIGDLETRLRDLVRRRAGSLVIVRQPAEVAVEAWGSPGDALPLMRALKQRLDPKRTLNPGRFVGGI